MYESWHKYKLLGPLLKKTKKPFCKKIKNRMAPGTSIDLQFRMILMCASPLRYVVSMVIGAQPGAQPVVVRLVTGLTEHSIP